MVALTVWMAVTAAAAMMALTKAAQETFAVTDSMTVEMARRRVWSL